MAAETMNAPVRRERKSFAQRVRGLWRRVEPGMTLQHDTSIERWDGCGEGPASVLAFEGFGLSFLVFIGRTPRLDTRRNDKRFHDLVRHYAGETL